ncbi:MAG: hypothetical protein OSB02_00605 [Rhodospirillaceae bacterium]|jgi:hypothetical protein|nr:hypothetical protein [Rhodospirillaceae bacterium]
MTHRFARLAAVALTALSLGATLFASVLAQSHAATSTTVVATEPCAEHQKPQGADFWADACESVCETPDNLMLVLTKPHGANSNDLNLTLVVYAAQNDRWDIPRAVLYTLHGHDPPSPALYLTTQRLRL